MRRLADAGELRTLGPLSSVLLGACEVAKHSLVHQGQMGEFRVGSLPPELRALSRCTGFGLIREAVGSVQGKLSVGARRECIL